jgi:predicted small metal-binding protein
MLSLACGNRDAYFYMEKDNLSCFWSWLSRRRNTMEKLLRCRDMDFDFEACGDTPEEVLKTAIDHARAIHGLQGIPEKDRIRAEATIQDAFCVPKGGDNPGGGVFH